MEKEITISIDEYTSLLGYKDKYIKLQYEYDEIVHSQKGDN